MTENSEERGIVPAMGRAGVIKWWERFWGAVWIIGSMGTAYWAARWMALNAAPVDLGAFRYGLIAFSGLLGWLVGAFVLSLTTIAIMSGLEFLLARVGINLRPPAPVQPETIEDTATAEDEQQGGALSAAEGD